MLCGGRDWPSALGLGRRVKSPSRPALRSEGTFQGSRESGLWLVPTGPASPWPAATDPWISDLGAAERGAHHLCALQVLAASTAMGKQTPAPTRTSNATGDQNPSGVVGGSQWRALINARGLGSHRNVIRKSPTIQNRQFGCVLDRLGPSQDTTL